MAVSSRRFYAEYHGHTVPDLEAVHRALGTGPRMFLVGDSTLDNKHWLRHSATEAAVNGFEHALEPARATPDVAHWLNAACAERGLDCCVLNCAVEEATLGARRGGRLLPQDAFVRSSITEQDTLLVSCGGNDIALKPTPWTIASMAVLLLCPKPLIASGWAPGWATLCGSSATGRASSLRA